MRLTDICASTPLQGVLIGALLLAAGAAIGNESEPGERLRELRTRLSMLQAQHSETRGRRDNVREEVAGLERRIGALTAGLKGLNARLRADGARLDKLRHHAREAREELRSERDGLARAVRAAHATGGQDTMKLLLNQDEPARVARVLAYHRYFGELRGRRIAAVEQKLSELTALEREIATKAHELETQRTEQLRQKGTLDEARARRGTLLASLNREVRNQARELEHMRADAAQLEQLLREMRPILRELPPPPAGARFGSLAGRLALPARGRVVARFNDPKPLGELRWRGILLATGEGEPFRAVARGRVAYADWLRGFGLLLILDHGDGYMTLYGHNQSLFKEVGDWVEAGETLGLVGSTGDAARPGLYFEVRHNGEPHDPLRWCVARAS